MKKAICIHLTLLSIGLAIFFLLSRTSVFEEKEPVCIALAAPLTGSFKISGQEMIRGVNLYIDEVNEAGGIDGRRVELRIFDDKNQVKKAMQAATDIAADDKILLVMGHYFATPSAAAGKIYKKSGIPAITASATAGTITEGNDWYFSVVPTNLSQANFIIHYISKIMKKKNISIIFVNNVYGYDLLRHFEKGARESGLEIIKKWGFDPQGKKINSELAKITAELRSVKDPGAIFVATDSINGAKIISSLKYPGTDYLIIGADAFTSSAFLRALNSYPHERAKPGYYSDGVYATSLLMFDTAGHKAYQFRKKFKAAYNEEATWLGACYYDAVYTAVEAIKKADIKGNIRRVRKEIRKALTGMYDQETGIQGIAGDIYFDKNGNTSRTVSMGFYENQRFIPAFSQYQLVSRLDGDTGASVRKALEGKIVLIDNKIMTRTQVVYTGIDINRVSNLDIKNGTYSADFYLWFRYKGELDPYSIRFPNMISHIILDECTIMEQVRDDINIRTYHIRADFKSDLDFHAYPFDCHILNIQLRHVHRQRESLIFVPDVLGMNEFSPGSLGDAMPGWYIEDISFHQDIVNTRSSLGLPEFFDSSPPINYSRFNADIQIKREDFGFAVRNFLPVMVMIIILYFFYLIPFDSESKVMLFSVRMLIITGVLVTNAIYHIHLLSEVNVEYRTVIEHGFLIIYLMILIAVLIFLLLFIFREGKVRKLIIYTGRVLYPIIIITAALVIGYFQGLFCGFLIF